MKCEHFKGHNYIVMHWVNQVDRFCSLLTYIPEYKDIWNGELEEIIYIAKLMNDNLKRKREIEVTKM